MFAQTEYVFDEAVFYALCGRASLPEQTGTGSVCYLRKGGTGMYRRCGFERGMPRQRRYLGEKGKCVGLTLSVHVYSSCYFVVFSS